MWKNFSWKENEKKRIESEYFEYEEERSKKKTGHFNCFVNINIFLSSFCTKTPSKMTIYAKIVQIILITYVDMTEVVQ